MVSINIPSIRSGDAGGGRKLTGKRRPKENLHISTNPCTILRKGAHFRTQELKTLGESLTYRRKTRWKEGREFGRKSRRSGGWEARSGAWATPVDSPAAGAGDWSARLPWWPAVWWLAAATREVHRERERTGREERERKWKNKRVFLFLKTHILWNYNFAPTFLEP